MQDLITTLKKTLRGLLAGGAFLTLALSLAAPLSSAQAADVLCCKCKNPATEGNVCLVSNTVANCDEMVSKNSQNTGLKNVVCTDKLDLSTECKTVPDNGVCKTIADPATYRRVENTTSTHEPYLNDAPTPKLNVAIPGLTFANRLDIVNERVIVPYLAQYIAALYKYLVGITVIAAAVMVTYGGFLYILGETVASVATAKKLITDALVGLVIVFGGYTILQFVNPFLLNNAALSLAIVRQSPWDIGQYRTEAPPGNAPISKADIDAQIKQELKNDAAEIPGDPDQNARAVITAAKEVGVDACLLLTICDHETALRNIWSGIQAKRPKETATAFGVCQIALFNVNAECPQGRKCNTLAGRLRERFPDFPAPPAGTTMSPSEAKELKLAKMDYLLTRPLANGYLGALVLRANIAGAGNNELMGVAGYGAGLMSIRQWAGAHGCKPTANLTVKQAKSNRQASLSSSCIPHTVAIAGKIGTASDCKDDGYDCANVKQNSSSEYVGSCPSSGEKCYAMVTDDFVNYVMNNYDRMAQKYGCDK